MAKWVVQSANPLFRCKTRWRYHGSCYVRIYTTASIQSLQPGDSNLGCQDDESAAQQTGMKTTARSGAVTHAPLHSREPAIGASLFPRPIGSRRFPAHPVVMLGQATRLLRSKVQVVCVFAVFLSVCRCSGGQNASFWLGSLTLPRSRVFSRFLVALMARVRAL